jgi:hypothetical protein
MLGCWVSRQSAKGKWKQAEGVLMTQKVKREVDNLKMTGPQSRA